MEITIQVAMDGRILATADDGDMVYDFDTAQVLIAWLGRKVNRWQERARQSPTAHIPFVTFLPADSDETPTE